MSGGTFDYVTYKFSQFADDLGMRIENNTKENDYGWCTDFDEETVSRLKIVRERAEELAELVKDVDYLYSADIGEENYRKRFDKIMKK